MVTQIDDSMTGWGAFPKGVSTGGKWTIDEARNHINMLELTAVRLSILNFTKVKGNISLHFHIDKKTAFLYLLKMGSTLNRPLFNVRKSIWQ